MKSCRARCTCKCPGRPHRRFYLGFLLAALVVLAGCDARRASTALAPAPTATSRPAPTATSLPELPLTEAWGDVPVFHLSTDMGDNTMFGFSDAASPDGQWLVGTIFPRDFLTNTTRPSYLALYNVRTRQVVRVRPLLHPQSQVLGASIDDHWLAWSEAPDQPAFFDWTMFLYNRDTGQTRELARAPRGADGQAAPGPATSPVVGGGHVLWSQPLAPITQGDDANLNNVVLRLEDLSTDQVTTLATKAGLSTLAWPWAAWGQMTAGTGGYMTLRNLATGQERRLPRQPATLALSGTSLAYDDLKAVYLVDDLADGGVAGAVDLGVRIAAAANEGDHLQFVTLNDRIVAWEEGVPQPLVWDRALHRIVRLPTTNGESSSWVGGRTLVWYEPEPEAQAQQDERNGLNPLTTINVATPRRCQPLRSASRWDPAPSHLQSRRRIAHLLCVRARYITP